MTPPEKKKDPRSWRGLTPPLAECESPPPFHHLPARPLLTYLILAQMDPRLRFQPGLP
ncbi:hypothetical protein LX32DRAFT_627856, partial [Colletotrichum zoysiae]